VTDDIVTRLRAEFDSCTCSGFDDCDCKQCHKRTNCNLYDLVGQAADEIERLRAEVARLGSFLHPVGMVVNTYGTSLTKRARDET
jgi:hypothetical protein